MTKLFLTKQINMLKICGTKTSAFSTICANACIHELGTVSLTSTGTLKKILVVKWMRNTLFDLSYRFPIHISQWKNTAKRPVWTGPGGICLQWGGRVGEGDRKKDWFYQSQIHWALKPFTKPLTVPQSWPQPSAPAAGATLMYSEEDGSRFIQ